MSQTHSRTDSVNGIPRWVKVFGIVALILIVLFGILHLSEGHGPGSHMPSMKMGAAHRLPP